MIEVNVFLKLTETNDAIARRLRTVPFNLSAIEKPAYDSLTDEERASGKYCVKNTYYCSDEFRETYKQALFEILIQHLNFEEVLVNVPEECARVAQNYMQSSDDAFSWIQDNFERQEGSIIKIMDMFALFKAGESYQNMNKADKRALTKKRFVEMIEKNIFLKRDVKQENEYYNGERIRAVSLVGWKLARSEIRREDVQEE